jgi:selenophosphate synthase
MKFSLIRIICRFLIASMMLMSFGVARAGMIGADQVAAGANLDRVVVMSALDRSDVSNALLANGVDPQAAKDRVAAMTDQEVSTLRGQIDALPAGGKTSNGWIVAGVIIIAIIIWYAWR